MKSEGGFQMGVLFDLADMKKGSTSDRMAELFTPGFMKRHTSFESFEEMKQYAKAEQEKKVLTFRPL
jgi:hypothetical protein